MIQTARLVLRRWRDDDEEPLGAINADPEVAYWLGGPTFAAMPGQMERYNAAIDEHGFGRFAVERLQDRALIGAIGPMPIGPGLEVSGFEIGWRLARSAWGLGYATEAAAAALAHAFESGLDEMLAFTALSNHRSQAVMARLGMTRDASRDFDHPRLEEDDPIRRHIVYVAHRS